MDNINVKIKDQEPIDEQLLQRKDFNKSFKKYELIKRSYAKLAAFWGASIGIAVFIGIGSIELLHKEQQSSNPIIKQQVIPTRVPASNEEQSEINAEKNMEPNSGVVKTTTDAPTIVTGVKSVAPAVQDEPSTQVNKSDEIIIESKSVEQERPVKKAAQKIQIEYELEE